MTGWYDEYDEEAQDLLQLLGDAVGEPFLTMFRFDRYIEVGQEDYVANLANALGVPKSTRDLHPATERLLLEVACDVREAWDAGDASPNRGRAKSLVRGSVEGIRTFDHVMCVLEDFGWHHIPLDRVESSTCDMRFRKVLRERLSERMLRVLHRAHRVHGRSAA